MVGDGVNVMVDGAKSGKLCGKLKTGFGDDDSGRNAHLGSR